MAQFQYTAVNSAGKRLSGVIGAGTEEEARKQLNTFGISLLAIEKVGETVTATVTQEPGTSNSLPKFEFEAYDRLGRKVLGTIPASNRYSAFKRLMEEYQFEVAYVVPLGASEEDRVKAKQEGLSVLKAEYETTQSKTGAEKEEEKLSKEFEGKRQELLQKVDFILDKIKGILNEFGADMKPESKKIVQTYVDKLLRIKSSTNLDYIENTSEELLKKVQDQELFLHKEKMISTRAKLKVQTEEMMAELHSTPAEMKITEQVEEAHNRLMESDNRLLKGLGNLIAKFLPTPEAKAVKQKISTINKQVWIYRKILWTAQKDAKEEARISLNRIKEERARLREELRQLKIKRQVVSKDTGLPEPLITEEINTFLGWLLGFYLLAYFASYYLLTKTISNPILGNFNLLNSGLLRTLLISIFLWHILLTLRLDYLKYRKFANLTVIVVGIVLNCSLVFNL